MRPRPRFAGRRSKKSRAPVAECANSCRLQNQMLSTAHDPARLGNPTEDHRCRLLPMSLLGASASRWRVALHRKHQLAGETPALPGSWAMSRTRLSALRCCDGSWRQFRGHRLVSCCAILLLALTLTATGDEQ